MIRPTRPEDKPALLGIAAAAIGFPPEEMEVLSQLLTEDCGSTEATDPFWITDTDVDQTPVGVAYCAPERMTQGTWNLLFIAVRPDHQGQGRGSALIRTVEQLLVERSARLLLVETVAHFDRTRAFYRKCGYEEEARIRDFYEAGADKIVYRKALVHHFAEQPVEVGS